MSAQSMPSSLDYPRLFPQIITEGGKCAGLPLVLPSESDRFYLIIPRGKTQKCHSRELKPKDFFFKIWQVKLGKWKLDSRYFVG